MSPQIDQLRPSDFVHLLVPAIVPVLVYGGYVVFFCWCMYIFRNRQPTKGNKVFLTGTVLLFILCTPQCILGSLSIIPGLEVLTYANYAIYVFTNLIADALFAYRCYVIWGCKKSIIWVSVLLICVETAAGGLVVAVDGKTFADKYGDISLFLTLATNVVLTLLAAGRIWWVSRELKILGPKVSQKYNTVIMLIVESGAMYCVAITAYLVSAWEMSSESIAPRTSFGILTQMVGIVPTLILFRTGLGISTEDAQTAILTSGIRFNHTVEGAEEADSPGMIHSTSERDTLIIDSGHI